VLHKQNSDSLGAVAGCASASRFIDRGGPAGAAARNIHQTSKSPKKVVLAYLVHWHDVQVHPVEEA